MKKRTYHSYLLWLVIIFSVVNLFYSPNNNLINQLIKTLPWVGLGILISEIILTIGFLMMLYIAAPLMVRKILKSIKNAINGIFNIKKDVEELNWEHVAKRCNVSLFFWSGFYVSIVGALGDGIVLILGIGKTLPIGSWGLMLLPFWDLGLTFIIRRAIYQGVKKSSSLLG